MPVWTDENEEKKGMPPAGFMVIEGKKIMYMDARAPETEPMLRAWTKNHLRDLLEGSLQMPPEYWYG